MKAQAGNVTLVAGLITTMGGIVAAALVMGAPVLSTVIDAETGESGLPLEIQPASNAPAPEAVATPPRSEAMPQATTPAAGSATATSEAPSALTPSADAGNWPYEQAAGTQPAPGAKRPDRLSAPEGWTPDAASMVGP